MARLPECVRLRDDATRSSMPSARAESPETAAIRARRLIASANAIGVVSESGSAIDASRRCGLRRRQRVPGSQRDQPEPMLTQQRIGASTSEGVDRLIRVVQVRGLPSLHRHARLRDDARVERRPGNRDNDRARLDVGVDVGFLRLIQVVERCAEPPARARRVGDQPMRRTPRDPLPRPA